MNTEHTNQSTAPEPFGYFKTEPFGWTDCEKGDEGAVPLYEHATVQGLQSQLEAERGSLFAESQRKQQLQDQVDALMEAMAKISRMTMSMYTSAGEAMRDAKRIAHEAIAAAEQAQQGKTVTLEQLVADLKAGKNGDAISAAMDQACADMELGRRMRELAQQADHIGDATEMAQPAEPVAHEFFAYDSECGFETFKTEAEAKKYAQESIDAYREEASEGWSEAVENICWGVVLGTTREVELPDEYSGGNGLADSMKPVDYVLTDAAQPPAVAVPTIKLGLYGRAFDTPQTRRAYTYQHQPENLDAAKLGRAAASTSPGGDSIDHGLSLLQQLQSEGFGVFELGDQQEGGA